MTGGNISGCFNGLMSYNSFVIAGCTRVLFHSGVARFHVS